VVIQACTELLNPSIFEHLMWFFVYANRAAAYFAQGDKQHALDDYNEAVKLAPHNADLRNFGGALADYSQAIICSQKLPRCGANGDGDLATPPATSRRRWAWILRSPVT